MPSSFQVPGPARIYSLCATNTSPMPARVLMAGGDGNGAHAWATVNGAGAVTGVGAIVSATGYTAAPTPVFVGSGGGAAGTTTVAAGAVSGITVAAGGSGYVGGGTPPTWEFVGFCENGVEVDFEDAGEDVGAEYAGNSPADHAYMGETASTTFVLKKADQAVIRKIMQRCRGSNRGTILPGDIGALRITEGRYTSLIVTAPYQASKSAFYGSQVPGIHLPFCYPTSMRDPFSVRVKRQPISFRAIPFVDAITGAGILYDFNTALVASVTLS